ncbi:hypothetical protein [Roseospira visakhapatnamensis]|uniref:Tail protein n=1 Tax=Roseospira visakhapatnamensis TaxID=390880 RepID=A0A7W6WC25_9PROT|nr:hypothetical protein [Roseospira visakhapatnamensis]MBB4268146.1 hypothetical protein [Roseospira visakhapatnamensis]
MALSTRNREILAALEAAYGQGAAAPEDWVALLAIDAELPSLTGQDVQRKTVQPHLGARPVGTYQERVPLSWSHEAVGSGDVAAPPHFDALLLASGWSRVALTGTATVAAAPIAVGTPTGGWSYVVGTGYTGLNRRRCTVTCTTAGGSGVAQATIAAPATGLGATAEAAHEATAVTITDATPISLPGGAEITPAMAADWAIGDQWVIELTPPGVEYWPSSDRRNHASAAVRVNLDGTLFEAPGARFQIGANFAIGGYPEVSFKGVGLWTGASATPTGNPDFSAIRDPEELDTYSLTLSVEPVDLSAAPWMPVGQSLTLRGGGDVVSKSRTTLDTVEVTDHEITADLVVEEPAADAVNVWDWVGQRRRVRAVAGTRLGERCEITLFNAQIGRPTHREDQGDVMVTIPLRALTPTGGGDDEVSIRFF